MSLRQKLLLLFSLTVAAAVAAVAWTVLLRIRQVFEQRDRDETALFVNQFQREFQHRSADVAAAIDRIAGQERVRNMAFELVQSGDAAPFLSEAQTLAQDARLDFLEVVGPDGNIVSSAQWPARFGYPEPAVREATRNAFLKREELADGSTALGLFAVQTVRGSEPAVKLIGGVRMDQAFLADLPVVPGMQVGLYTETNSSGGDAQDGGTFAEKHFVGPEGTMPGGAKYAGLIKAARGSGHDASGILYMTPDRADSVAATAIPLKNSAGGVLAVLTVAISRGGLVAEQQQVKATAYGVAAGGILLAIIFSLWIAARVSRPVEELARAAEEVAGGSWDARVPVRGRDEVSVLARSFNHMTEQLENQRERLVQSERVAAWRELARRLAHELKNPLFPLQLTVENLARARLLPPAEFDEVFNESTQTLSMEIGNLKKIIGRFSDFSKMPKPELERIDAKDAIARVRNLYAAAAEDGPRIEVVTKLENAAMPLMADPELLHRALSNLVLNAKDAMPEGGTVTISARNAGSNVEIRVSDTGQGMTPEECERLFTPYYTTKQHGTGLGLAIVQSVVADHAGTISVESREGQGATFVISLPRAKG
ncbi:sensor histidine kinase [Occallatibacter savannae]|uniref:sensor histidine kinase n=1 Tax=Occallatibacter savannae TaxID=1002691 RepID=UPI000D68EF1F|nr:ATP-binding protein [Occallatibacter savannae]